MSCFLCPSGFSWCSLGQSNTEPVALKDVNRVMLDTNKAGTECVILNSGLRICGTGAALANAPLVQNKSYFEVKVRTGGTWGLGVATASTDLDDVPLGKDTQSWVLTSDGAIVHNGAVVAQLPNKPLEGNVIGVSYDHVELNFFVNGRAANCPVRGIRGKVLPVVYVDDEAILDVSFTEFTFPPPDGYDAIMFERGIL